MQALESQLPCLGAVLVGGKSKRMGTPKSVAILDSGEYLLERVVRTARQFCREVVLVGAGPIPQPLLIEERLPDADGIEGPLAGVLSALRWEPSARWLILACDLPLVTTEAIRWLLSQAMRDAVAVLPHLDDPSLAEPLFALYDPAAKPLLEKGARDGRRSIQRILAEEKVVSPRVPEELRPAWTNVNTPEAWEAVQRRLSGEPKQ